MDYKIGLKDAIQAVYEELAAAVTEIPLNANVNFRYRTIDLEFTVEVAQDTGGTGGVKFWVLNAGANVSKRHAKTHVVKLSIEPLRMIDGSDLLISGEDFSTP